MHAQTLLVTAGRDKAVHAEVRRPQPSKFFTSRHCERSEAIQGGLSRLDGFLFASLVSQ